MVRATDCKKKQSCSVEFRTLKKSLFSYKNLVRDNPDYAVGALHKFQTNCASVQTEYMTYIFV
jgi:hypothetical protein